MTKQNHQRIMKLIDQLKKACGIKISYDATDSLATLILAARENDKLKRELKFLLSLPESQRTPLVLTAVEEMKMRGEPPEICEAFSILATAAGAAAATKAIDQS